MTDDENGEPVVNPDAPVRSLTLGALGTGDVPRLGAGCTLVLMMACFVLGFLLFTSVGPNANITAQSAPSSQSNPQDSALPVIQPSTNANSTPAAPTPTPSDQTPTQQTPTQQPSGQTPSDQSQNPTQQASPPPANNTPPPPSCTISYPSRIDIQGGDPGSIEGSGGSFTATTTDPVLVASVDNCGDGHHFEISWSSNGTNADGTTGSANGTDCQMSQFNTVVSNTNPGYTVSVQMILPVNSCG